MIVLGHMIFSAYIRKQFRGNETKREFLKMEAATAEERFVDFTVLHYVKTIFDHCSPIFYLDNQLLACRGAGEKSRPL